MTFKKLGEHPPFVPIPPDAYFHNLESPMSHEQLNLRALSKARKRCSPDQQIMLQTDYVQLLQCCLCAVLQSAYLLHIKRNRG